MRVCARVCAALLLLGCATTSLGYEDATTLEDDDFAEFEQFDADDELDNAAGYISEDEGAGTAARKPPAPPPPPAPNHFLSDDMEEDMIVEDEDNEFEHFHDPEEFEGFAEGAPQGSEQPKITISKVPIMVRSRWDAYWLEGVLLCVLSAYALNYAVGRARNTGIAANILRLHKPLLDDNFTLVGEAGADVTCGGEAGWRREAEHCFTMWCSGRSCCEGMLLTLKLIKRQDLVHLALQCVRPAQDTLQLRVELGKEDCDPFVFCVATKKLAARLSREMHDLSTLCGERRAGDKHGLPASLSVLSEVGEASSLVLDARVTAALTQYADSLQFLHISDQYSGPKQQDEAGTATKPPETQKVLLLSVTLSADGAGPELRPVLLLVFYLLDKLKRARLSKEALNKCERNRQRAAEAFIRETHAARQEQAAARREERRKAEKERILAEDDPEKQRRWEKKEQKRQMKRNTPKMKQLRVKAL